MTDLTTNVFLELHVPDFKVAVDFYRILGFDILWMSDEYLVMKKGKSILNFYKGTEEIYNHSYFCKFPRNTKRGYAVEIILIEENLKKFYEDIKDKVKIVAPLKLKRWGAWDFRLEDPFGFYVRVTESHDWINNPEKIKETSKIMRKKGIL